MADEVGMSFDVKEIDAVGKSLSKIGARSGRQVQGALTAAQAKSFWRGPAKKLVAREAVRRAPRSKLTGKAVWTRGKGGKKRSYVGKHGAFKLQSSVQSSPFGTGTGSYFSLGGKRTKFGPYIGVVGKFPTFGARRAAGGGSVKVAPNPWLIDAINASSGRIGAAYVRLIEEAIQTEIDKGVRRAAK